MNKDELNSGKQEEVKHLEQPEVLEKSKKIKRSEQQTPSSKASNYIGPNATILGNPSARVIGKGHAHNKVEGGVVGDPHANVLESEALEKIFQQLENPSISDEDKKLLMEQLLQDPEKSPSNAIKAYNRMLERGNLSLEKEEEIIEKIAKLEEIAEDKIYAQKMSFINSHSTPKKVVRHRDSTESSVPPPAIDSSLAIMLEKPNGYYSVPSIVDRVKTYAMAPCSNSETHIGNKIYYSHSDTEQKECCEKGKILRNYAGSCRSCSPGSQASIDEWCSTRKISNNFSSTKLIGHKLSGEEKFYLNLAGLIFSSSIFNKTEFQYVSFANSNLSYCSFERSSFKKICLNRTILKDVDITSLKGLHSTWLADAVWEQGDIIVNDKKNVKKVVKSLKIRGKREELKEKEEIHAKKERQLLGLKHNIKARFFQKPSETKPLEVKIKEIPSKNDF